MSLLFAFGYWKKEGCFVRVFWIEYSKTLKMSSKQKVIVVGNYNVGKSSTVKRIIEDVFDEAIPPTIADTVKYTHKLDDDSEVEMWFTDTAGEERFKSMTSSFYRNATAILLVYDCSDRKSYEDLIGFLQEANRFNERGLKFIVSCKTDLDPEVDAGEAEEFAKNESLDGFFAISNKTGDGVKEFINSLATKIQEKGGGTKAAPSSSTTVDIVNQTQQANQQKKGFCNLL